MIRQTGRVGVGRDLDQVELLLAGLGQRLGQGPDPELLAVGADEEDLAGSDAVVDPDLVCSYVVTSSSEFLRGGTWTRDATMADTGMSAIRRSAQHLRCWSGSHNMRTRRTWSVAWCSVAGWGRSGIPLPCIPVLRPDFLPGYTGEQHLDTIRRAPRPEDAEEPDGGGPSRRHDDEPALRDRRRIRGSCSGPGPSWPPIPVADIVANHAIGLQQLAVLHLIPDPGPDGSPTEPRLDEAGPRHRRLRRPGRRPRRPPRPAPRGPPRGGDPAAAGLRRGLGPQFE